MKEKDTRTRVLESDTPQNFETMAKSLNIGADVLKATIKGLQKEGYSFAQTDESFIRSTTQLDSSESNHTRLFDTHYLHFGIVSDTHLGSKKERLDALELMYDVFVKEGIKTVYHAGDITDGFGVYRGQEFEVNQFGQQEQVDYAVAKYPKRDGITTYFITGNHDLKQYEQGGIDIGTSIARLRKDMRYLGQATADIKMPQGIKFELLHPAGNVAYALSYKAQRDINNRPPSDLPDILVYGHYHSSYYMHYRGIDFLQAPCFKNAGIWEKRLGLNPVIGGWLVDATISTEGRHINKFQPTLVRP